MYETHQVDSEIFEISQKNDEKSTKPTNSILNRSKSDVFQQSVRLSHLRHKYTNPSKGLVQQKPTLRTDVSLISKTSKEAHSSMLAPSSSK